MPADPSQRYARQALLPDFGPESGPALARSRVAVVGCGALGTVVAESLVRAGVGHTRIVDRDLVDASNLQRQTLFTQQDADDAVPKSLAAADRLRLINPSVEIEPIVADADPRNIERLLSDAHAVVDATDNFQIRYLLNDACVRHARPLIYGGAIATRGMSMTILPRAQAAPSVPWTPTPCLRCVFPDPPAPGAVPTCDTAGVLGTVTGIVANLQATETLKVLLSRWDLVNRSLFEIDPWANHHRRIDLTPMLDPDCPCCARRRFDHLQAPASSIAALCGQDAVQIPASSSDQPNAARPDLRAMADRLASALSPDAVRATPHFLRATIATPRGDRQLTLFPDGRAIIRGVADTAEARSLYARYVGG